jgi:transcriptional regulator GlxA family with amidase domain
MLTQTIGMAMKDESRPKLRSIAVIIDHGVAPFEFGIACEVFGVDRSDQGLPKFDFAVCSVRPGPVRTSIGFQVIATHDMSAVDTADLVLIPPFGQEQDRESMPELDDALRRTIARGGRVASLCTGSFMLARAGLLDGRRSATHWFHEDDFREQFPHVELLTDVLYVEDGPVITSAGTAAGIDMCLHLVRQAHGAEAANGIARRMVVPPQRDGGQAQFVQAPVRPESHTLAPVLDWAREHLAEDLPISKLAVQASMSERTFARRFREETGTTPHHWLQSQRVALAETLLERGDLGIEQIAQQCGFGSGAMLRHHFNLRRRTTPMAYRRTFSTAAS